MLMAGAAWRDGVYGHGGPGAPQEDTAGGSPRLPGPSGGKADPMLAPPRTRPRKRPRSGQGPDDGAGGSRL